VVGVLEVATAIACWIVHERQSCAAAVPAPNPPALWSQCSVPVYCWRMPTVAACHACAGRAPAGAIGVAVTVSGPDVANATR